MNKMSYSEFLKTVSVMKMLYGQAIAERFFKKNIVEFPQFNYDDDSESLLKQKRED